MRCWSEPLLPGLCSRDPRGQEAVLLCLILHESPGSAPPSWPQFPGQAVSSQTPAQAGGLGSCRPAKRWSPLGTCYLSERIGPQASLATPCGGPNTGPFHSPASSGGGAGVGGAALIPGGAFGGASPGSSLSLASSSLSYTSVKWDEHLYQLHWVVARIK